MPEADGLEYPGRKYLIGLARGYTAFSARIEPEIDIDNAELVFAGYGS